MYVKYQYYALRVVDIHLVLLQGATLFGFKCATINTEMVPNNADVVDIHLVLPQMTTLFGFIYTTINVYLY